MSHISDIFSVKFKLLVAACVYIKKKKIRAHNDIRNFCRLI